MEDLLETIIPRESIRETGEACLESALVLACQAGDAASFNRLVLKWEGKIYNLCLRMLGNQEDAADSTQEVFLQAFRNIRKFRMNSRFSTWLYRIAVNHCIDVLNRRAGLRFQDSWDDESGSAALRVYSGGTQEADLLHDERQRKILECLAFLPAEQRSVVELKFFQEETFGGIAGILKVPESTVKSRFYTALEILKERLGLCAEEIL